MNKTLKYCSGGGEWQPRVVRVDVLLLQAVGGGCGAAAAAVCPACGKAFQGRNRRQNLSHHLLTHTGTRPFPCPNCSYRATQKAHLKRHLERRHSGQQADVRLQASSSRAGVDMESTLSMHPLSRSGVLVGSVGVERGTPAEHLIPRVGVGDAGTEQAHLRALHNTSHPNTVAVNLGMESPQMQD